MALGLRLRDFGGAILDNNLEITEGASADCYGCDTLNRMPSKRKVLLWLWRQAKRRYPNLTVAQFKTKLIAWLNNHPAVRDALPDGEGW